MSSPTTDPLRIVIEALRSPWSDAVLDDVRRNREKIVEALDNDSGSLLEVDNLDPSWVAYIGAVLDAAPITSDDAFKIDSSPISPESSREEAEADVGTRFAEFVRALPSDLRWFETLADLLPTDPENRDRMLASPACVAAQSVGVTLAKYGLSPLTFTYAAQGVARALRKGTRRRRQSDLEVCVSADEQIAEIAAFCRVDKVVARKLLIWLQRASEYSNNIIPGFVAGRKEKRLFFGKNRTALESRFKQDESQPVAATFHQEYDVEH